MCVRIWGRSVAMVINFWLELTCLRIGGRLWTFDLYMVCPHLIAPHLRVWIGGWLAVPRGTSNIAIIILLFIVLHSSYVYDFSFWLTGKWKWLLVPSHIHIQYFLLYSLSKTYKDYLIAICEKSYKSFFFKIECSKNLSAV